jgi:hypothetical protein
MMNTNHEIVRRLAQREKEGPEHDSPRISVQYAADEKPDRPRRRSPSIMAISLFTVMCYGSAYYAAKIMQLSGISRASEHSPMHYSIPAGIKALELEVQSIAKLPVFSCQTLNTRDAKSFETGSLCPALARTSNNHILIYNPSAHDKFICNGKLILGPKKLHLLELDKTNTEDCWKRPIESLLIAHSFREPPTYENRGAFPGILVEAISSNENGYDDSFSSNYVSKRTMLTSKDPSFPKCDVKCDFETLTGINQRRFIYGTDWEFLMSMEGEEYYPELKINPDAWRDNVSRVSCQSSDLCSTFILTHITLHTTKKFFATTSFKSEVPLQYFSFAEYSIQSPAVSFKDGIKGASFLANNCESKNNREEVVQKLMNTAFRVDSLSRCLNNVDPDPEFDLSNKGALMKKYLFVSTWLFLLCS